jgi:hypothetical protein
MSKDGLKTASITAFYFYPDVIAFRAVALQGGGVKETPMSAPSPSGALPFASAEAAPSPERLLEALLNQNQAAALKEGLRTVFSGAPLEAAERLQGGASGARLVRVEAKGVQAVIRIEPPGDPKVRAAAYGRLASVAAAGLAPRLLHADPSAGISISAFVTAGPHPPGRALRLQRQAKAVRRLHDAPLFASAGEDYFTILLGLWKQLAGADSLPAPLASSSLQGLGRLIEGYRSEKSDLVSSHNDLNPSNLLFDGEAILMVDWESAFPADRYVDLSALATFQAWSERDERTILAAYFGRPPVAAERGRYALMRQINLFFYAAVLIMSARRQGAPRLRLEEVERCRRADLNGRMERLTTVEGRLAFGCALLNEALAALA